MKDYGDVYKEPECETLDLDPQEFQKKKTNFLNNFKKVRKKLYN